MNDRLVTEDRSFNEGSISDIAGEDRQLAAQRSEICGVPARGVVEDRDLVASGRQSARHMRAEETKSTGDKDAHSPMLPQWAP